jgi:hypothetical protein
MIPAFFARSCGFGGVRPAVAVRLQERHHQVKW